MDATLEVRVGRLLCGTIRQFLRECQFRGMRIEWIESCGWLRRRFIVRGDVASLRHIEDALSRWDRGEA